jgi:hypothetical protein
MRWCGYEDGKDWTLGWRCRKYVRFFNAWQEWYCSIQRGVLRYISGTVDRGILYRGTEQRVSMLIMVEILIKGII